MGKHGPEHQSHLDRLIRLWVSKHAPVPGSEKLRPAATDICIGSLNPLELRCKAMRQSDVICVHARNPLASRHPDSLIQCLDQPAIFPGHQNHPMIPAEPLQEFQCAIRRTIINDDELKIGEGLSKNGLDGGLKILPAIEYREQH